MTRYVVHARRFAGTLAEPTRNDTASDGSDDYREAVRVAEGMAARGWSVWVFEDADHGTGPAVDFTPGAASPGSRLRAVGEWRPDGTRRR